MTAPVRALPNPSAYVPTYTSDVALKLMAQMLNNPANAKRTHQWIAEQAVDAAQTFIAVCRQRGVA